MENKIENNTLETGYKQELKAGSIGIWALVAYAIAFMVPIAPMAVFGYVSNLSGGMVPLVYLVALTGMMFTAISYARMAAIFPFAGSIYNYVQRGLNPHFGFIAAWLIIADYFLVPAVSYSFASMYMMDFVPVIPAWVWIIAFVAFNTFINVRGVSFTANANLSIVGAQLLCLAGFLYYSITYLINNHISISLEPFWRSGNVHFMMITSAASIAVFSMIGFDTISTLSEEAKDPKKNIPKATILCLFVAGFIFLAQTYMAQIVTPNFQNLDPDMGFYDIAQTVGGLPLRLCLLGAMLIGLLASAMVAQASVSRIFYSLSRDKLFPAFLGKIHPVYKTPHLASLFIAVISIILAVFIPLSQIITLINFGALSAYLFMNFTIFWYFYIKLKERGPVSVGRNIFLPLCGLVVIGFLWAGLNPVTKIIGLTWLVIGIIIGLVKSKGYKTVPEAFTKIEM